VNATVPSGRDILVPWKSSLMTMTFVPALTTPAISGATVSVAGGTGACPWP
jgi:hypothetical protein